MTHRYRRSRDTGIRCRVRSEGTPDALPRLGCVHAGFLVHQGIHSHVHIAGTPDALPRLLTGIHSHVHIVQMPSPVLTAGGHGHPFSCAYRRHSRCPPSAADAQVAPSCRWPSTPDVRSPHGHPCISQRHSRCAHVRVSQQRRPGHAQVWPPTAAILAQRTRVHHAEQSGILHRAPARPRGEREEPAREVVELGEYEGRTSRRTSGGRDPKKGPSGCGSDMLVRGRAFLLVRQRAREMRKR